MYLQITVTIQGKELNSYSFAESEILIGRSAECDVLLDNAGVSRTHAKLLRQGDQVMVVDLLSGNGTFLNGQRVTQAQVSPTDTIGIGKFSLAAKLSAEDLPQTPSPVSAAEPDVVSSSTVFLRPEETQRILQQAQGAKQAPPVVARPTQVAAPPSKQTHIGWVFAAGALLGLICGWLIWG
jgi:pSer/pThr/pTyr-binding forkhead associated (FHA) protein